MRKFNPIKGFSWDMEKNPQLIRDRGVSFVDVIFNLQMDGLRDEIENPNQKRYAHQRMFIVAVESYAYLVPYVESDKEIFLKTIIPNRKATKQYLGGKNE